MAEDEDLEVIENSEVQITSNPLTKDMMPEFTSTLCKVGFGLDYAYTKLVAHIGDNAIEDVSPLTSLTFLLSLKVDKNLLENCILKEMRFLQIADFSSNKIKIPDGIYHGQLERLNLSFNQISYLPELNSSRLKSLRSLELRGNHLPSTAHLSLPSLHSLYLAQNEIATLLDLSDLRKLTIVHLRDNVIKKLDGFSAANESLEYLNLRNNKITDINEVRKLNCLPALKRVILLGNEINFTDDEGYPLRILMMLPSLAELNKTTFTPADREEARQQILLKQKEEKERRKRLRQEAAQKKEEEETVEEGNQRRLSVARDNGSVGA